MQMRIDKPTSVQSARLAASEVVLRDQN